MKKNQTDKKVRRRNAGFTLVELLVSMAIMLLFTIIMTSLMDTATVAYTQSVDCSNSDVFLSSAINRLRLELTDARNVYEVSGADFTSSEGKPAKVAILTDGKTVSEGVVYTDAATGAEALIFISAASETEESNVYMSKYGEVKPLIFTTDNLNLTIQDIVIDGNKIAFEGLKSQKSGTVYSSVDEITVKLK